MPEFADESEKIIVEWIGVQGDTSEGQGETIGNQERTQDTPDDDENPDAGIHEATFVVAIRSCPGIMPRALEEDPDLIEIAPCVDNDGPIYEPVCIKGTSLYEKDLKRLAVDVFEEESERFWASDCLIDFFFELVMLEKPHIQCYRYTLFQQVADNSDLNE